MQHDHQEIKKGQRLAKLVNEHQTRGVAESEVSNTGCLKSSVSVSRHHHHHHHLSLSLSLSLSLETT